MRQVGPRVAGPWARGGGRAGRGGGRLHEVPAALAEGAVLRREAGGHEGEQVEARGSAESGGGAGCGG